jgi:DNA invertase Pin-like site-specific DNA recombinase
VTAHPAAYLRRSYVDAHSPGDISLEAQRAAVSKLAHADGHNGDVVEYSDWGVSADHAKAGKRTQYAQLLADMEAGSVSAVYAFDVDRLYRDPRDLIRLQDAAQRHRVRIVTTSGELAIGDGDDPSAEAFAFIGSVFGRMELSKIKKRNRAARDARLARGDTLGRAPYGYRMERQADGSIKHVLDPSQPLEPILEAFTEAGSFNGAAKMLNARGIPAPMGGKWAGNIVNKIIRRERPGLVPRGRTEARIAPRGTHLFSRLLKCSCGRILTPRQNRRQVTKYGTYGPYTGYQCYDGRHDPDHPRPYMISERIIREWAMVEAARFAPSGIVARSVDHERRKDLEDERERVGIAFTRRAISLEAMETRQAEIDAELASLDAAEEAVGIPESIDWDRWQHSEINAVLRAYWEHVELDADMRPVRAAWRLPAEWLA